MSLARRSFTAFFVNLAVITTLSAVLLVTNHALAAEAAPQSAAPTLDAGAATPASPTEQQDSPLFTWNHLY